MVGSRLFFEISIMKLCVRGLLKTLSVKNFTVQPIFFGKSSDKRVCNNGRRQRKYKRVIPSEFHNYENLFNADDLISAGVFVQFVQEVKRLYEK